MQLTQENAQSLFADSNKALFLFFYDDNPDCDAAKRALETAISDNNEYITPILCNVQEQIGMAVAQQVMIRALPTLVVIKDKQPADILEGGDQIVASLQDLINQFTPNEAEMMMRDALALAAEGKASEAVKKAASAYEMDESNLSHKFIYVRLLIESKNTQKARELLEKAGREERESSEYESLMSALVLAEQAQNSPELLELKAKFEQDPSDENAVAYAVALSDAGKKDEALEMLFTLLKTDLNREAVKKTFIDIINTLSDNRQQNVYRRRLYTLMY